MAFCTSVPAATVLWVPYLELNPSTQLSAWLVIQTQAQALTGIETKQDTFEPRTQRRQPVPSGSSLQVLGPQREVCHVAALML